jgi:bifunctional enzyme CysN/CysC
MDLVGYSQARFDEICDDYRAFASRLQLPDLHFIPLAALHGENVVDPSANMSWYRGSTLMNFLESVYIGSDRNFEDFRLPIQIVNRPNLDFRGFCGTVASGIIRQGDEIMVLPAKRTSKVKRIVTFDGDVTEAFTPQSITLVLEDEVDCSRGDMIVRPGNIPKIANSIDATIVWMSTDAMVPGKTYLFKHTTQTVTGQIDSLKYRVDVNTLHRVNAPDLQLNEIGRCSVTLSQPIYFDAYRRNRTTGSFIIIDRITNATVGAGMISDRDSARQALAAWESTEGSEITATGEVSQVSDVERAARFGQKPATLLFTGLPSTGKTTIASAVERALFDAGRAVSVLDGELMRRGVNKDLGYTVEERSENLRRSAHVAKLFNDHGLICLAAFVAPSQSVRDRVAEVIGKDRFFVIHCKAEESTRSQRLKVAGESDTTTVDRRSFGEYEAPDSPDLVLDTGTASIAECVDAVVEMLKQKQIIR